MGDRKEDRPWHDYSHEQAFRTQNPLLTNQLQLQRLQPHKTSSQELSFNTHFRQKSHAP